MFHGEKTIPGPRPTEQSRGTEVVADTAGRQYFSRGKHRQETFSDTTGRQKVQLSHATQNFMQEKNRQAGKNKIPHQKNRNEISGDTSPRQNFIQEKSRKEILVDPSGRQNFPHGKNREEILVDPPGRQNFPQEKNREEILVDPSGRQNFPHGKNKKEITIDPSGRQNFPHGKNRKEIPVDPSGRQNFSHGKNRKEILVDPSGRQNFPHGKIRKEIPVDPSGRQNFSHGKIRKEIPVDPSGRQNFPHGKSRKEILVDPSGRQNSPHGEIRKEILVDPSGRRNFHHGKNRKEILDDPSDRQNFPHGKNRQEILVDPTGRQNFPHGKNRKEILDDPSDRQNFPHGKNRQQIIDDDSTGTQNSTHMARERKITTALSQNGIHGSGVGESTGGSASLTPPDGGENLRLHNENMKRKEGNRLEQDIIALTCKWSEKKNSMSDRDFGIEDKKRIIGDLANTCTELVRLHGGKLGDVAKGIGGTLVSPPLDVRGVEQYFGNLKRFPAIDDLLEIVANGVPARTTREETDLDKALQYGNHRSVGEHLPRIWEKLFDDVRRNRCLVLNRAAAAEVAGIRIAPLAAVVTNKVRIINDFSFDPTTARGVQGGLNRDTLKDEIPRCLCGKALPKFLAEITSLRVKYPDKRILMSKADVSDAFRNVRVAPDQAQNFCYVLDDVLVADLRLTFGWAGSPGFWGVMSAAAEHAHCHTSLTDAIVLPEGAEMMSHVRIADPWEVGQPTRVPREAGVRPAKGGGRLDPFFTTVYVDDYMLVRVQQDSNDQSALVASASLASEHVRLFGQGEIGETPILAPKKSTDWDTTIEALGYTIDSHRMRISTTQAKIEAIKLLLEREWPPVRKMADAQEVLSIAGKLWNLTFVVRAGRYFVWQLLRLTGLHKKGRSKSRIQRVVRLGWEFHGDIAFWKWAIDQRLINQGESLSAPFYAHVLRRPVRHYFSDASFDAIGGYCPELRIFWRYTLDPQLSSEMKRKAQARESCAITINLLELCGMVITAFVVQLLLGDRPTTEGESIMMRGDNMSAVSWVNRCGGSRDRRAGILMRLLGRMEITSGWCHVAKHIPGVDNRLADGISRWPEKEVQKNVSRLTQEQGWTRQEIAGGNLVLNTILNLNLPKERLDDDLWGQLIA